MATFSKPVQGSTDAELPAKRKRILNHRLTDKNNIHEDAVKRRKTDSGELPKISKKPIKKSSQSTAQKQKHSPTASQKPPSRQSSIEVVEDEDDHIQCNAGPPRNPDSILEAANGGNDSFFLNLAAAEKAAGGKKARVDAAEVDAEAIEIGDDSDEEDGDSKHEETAEEELGE